MHVCVLFALTWIAFPPTCTQPAQPVPMQMHPHEGSTLPNTDQPCIPHSEYHYTLPPRETSSGTRKQKEEEGRLFCFIPPFRGGGEERVSYYGLLLVLVNTFRLFSKQRSIYNVSCIFFAIIWYFPPIYIRHNQVSMTMPPLTRETKLSAVVANCPQDKNR